MFLRLEPHEVVSNDSKGLWKWLVEVSNIVNAQNLACVWLSQMSRNLQAARVFVDIWWATFSVVQCICFALKGLGLDLGIRNNSLWHTNLAHIEERHFVVNLPSTGRRTRSGCYGGWMFSYVDLVTGLGACLEDRGSQPDSAKLELVFALQDTSSIEAAAWLKSKTRAWPQ